eukprot:CAMPEP_0183524852 /NCGR_PEP_ID=MMETSP0371-20130417/20203_1 /TAXON_ID=268820 /ORGANISM="Peridinium aciculiferum, Strain PAER-2" /LENGTH=357 /DNA_ID=CAMNT_0025724013 /DNA_START=275 /DNA_END=1350 /DNA_ORIENTATION=+
MGGANHCACGISSAAPSGAAKEACDPIVGDEEGSAPFTDQQHHGSNSQDRGQGGSSCCDDAESPTDQLELSQQAAIWACAAPHQELRMAMHLVARRQARHFAPSEHLAAPAAHVVATSVLLDQGAACRAALQMGLASNTQHLVHGEVRQINTGVERAAYHLKHAADTPRKWLHWKFAALQLALTLRTPRQPTLPRARLAVLPDTRPAERMAARQPLHICDTVAGAEADGALPTKALAPPEVASAAAFVSGAAGNIAEAMREELFEEAGASGECDACRRKGGSAACLDDAEWLCLAGCMRVCSAARCGPLGGRSKPLVASSAEDARPWLPLDAASAAATLEAMAAEIGALTRAATTTG